MPDAPKHRRTSSDLERRRLLYLLSEALEKLSRLQRILERQRSFVEAEYRRSEYTDVIDTLVNALASFRSLLIQNRARIGSFLRNENPTEPQLKAVNGVVRKIVDPVLKIHELLVLLPRESAEPQVFFMLADCFRKRGRLPASVILTNLLSSYEYRVEDILRAEMSQQELPDLKAALRGFKPGGSVLGLAFADRDNPLAWAILAHEYGHSIDDTRKIAHGIVRRVRFSRQITDDNRRKLVRWVAELFCDFVAARVLGPASLIPILFVEMARSTLARSSESPTHPPTPVRLRLTRKYLADLHLSTSGFEDLFEVYEFDYEKKLRALGAAERKRKEDVRTLADGLLAPLGAKIASEVSSLRLRRFDEDNADRARTLQAKLEAGLPASCHRRSSNDEILTKLASLKDKSSTRAVYAALEELNELPAASSEIIAAGWLYKLSSFGGRLLQTFPGRAAKLDLYGEYLERVDALLLKSLELAAVHNEINSPTG